MDIAKLEKVTDFEWRIAPRAGMNVPAVIYASEALIRDMDEKVFEQVTNVARLPGIVTASYAMPDAHWGYGFPIGGVAAFDAAQGGVVSAGGVGFDISCGVRLLTTGLKHADLDPKRKALLANALFERIPAGVGSTGAIRLDGPGMDAMLRGGARWRWSTATAVRPISTVSKSTDRWPVPSRNTCPSSRSAGNATRWARWGSGNHYLEVQHVVEVFAADAAEACGLRVGDLVVSIHCGSRGLGHQIGTEFLKEMVIAAGAGGIVLPDRELACAPIDSEVGSAISVRCARRSIARSPIDRSSPI